jgi:hypothetical protein
MEHLQRESKNRDFGVIEMAHVDFVVAEKYKYALFRKKNATTPWCLQFYAQKLKEK